MYIVEFCLIKITEKHVWNLLEYYGVIYAFLLSIFIKYTLSIQNYDLHTYVSKVPFIETKNIVHHTVFAYLYNVFSFGGGY